MVNWKIVQELITESQNPTSKTYNINIWEHLTPYLIQSNDTISDSVKGNVNYLRNKTFFNNDENHFFFQRRNEYCWLQNFNHVRMRRRTWL